MAEGIAWKLENHNNGNALASQGSEKCQSAVRHPRRKLHFTNSHAANTPVLGLDSWVKGADRLWTADEEALLGTAVDSKIADLLKIDFWLVFYRRKAMNIPPYEFAYP